MWDGHQRSKLTLVVVLGLALAGCGTSAGATPTVAGNGPNGTAPPTSSEEIDDGEDPFAGVDVCQLATAEEVTAVMGVDAHDPTGSVLGPGAAIDGAKGCAWSLGDSIDLFDLWIYPPSASGVAEALDDFWADGYAIEPVAGVGDEAFAAVWRGDESVRAVGQVAGVGVRQGAKAVLLTTLLLGEEYLDPKPAADLALKILGRF
jgi:hypothetical protein